MTWVATPSLGFDRGRKPLGLLGSLIWLPKDYLRIYFSFTLRRSPEAVVAEAVDKCKYCVDTVTARAPLDF